MSNDEIPRLEVYRSRSVYFGLNGEPEIFNEGTQSNEAKARQQTIKEKLQGGYFQSLIDTCRTSDTNDVDLPIETQDVLRKLVDSVSSEVGRALVGLSVLQLSIKSIEPGQSIRLHKSGHGGGSTFSWTEGVSMRTLDAQYITPVLRSNGLLNLNADGFMMTRSLAENYPYGAVYKAAMRGARDEWLDLVEQIESNKFDFELGLKYLIGLLINSSDRFEALSKNVIELLKAKIDHFSSIEAVANFLMDYVDTSQYSARIFEISMHSFFQAAEELELLEASLLPLSQMRSANKKHGNIGDIELHAGGDTEIVLESWDAKYGKPYLRDELDELLEKIIDKPSVAIAGFVVDRNPDLRDEISARQHEVAQMTGVDVPILDFMSWSDYCVNRMVMVDPKLFASKWIIAFVESLCQMRRSIAPIDEPSELWVNDLFTKLNRI